MDYYIKTGEYHIIVLIRVDSELEINEFVSPNANHFWSNCESLWPTDSQ